MPRWLEHTYDTTHAIATGTIGPAPKSSTAITVQAMGVFVAPAKTATKPIAANSGLGACSAQASVEPSVAPMTNSGVTSPPWNPDPSVTAVNSNFHAKAITATPAPPASEAVMSGRDRP